MKYRYVGYDLKGRAVEGVIEAPDAMSAREQARRDSVFVEDVEPAGEGRGSGRSAGGPQRGRRTQDERAARGASGGEREVARGGGLIGSGARVRAVAGFTRQLSVLVATGTPLVDAIASLERQERDERFRVVLRAILDRLEQGTMLSDAVREHPAYFSGVACSLVQAGEQGGKLDEMLGRLARLARQEQKVRATVSGALIYPALLITVSLVVVVAMLFFVLPRFEGLFATLGTPLPVTTRVLMDISGGIRENWIATGGIAGVVLGAVAAVALTPTGRARVFNLALGAPVLGATLRSLATARIARVMGVLLEGKVPMHDALHLTRGASGSVPYARLVSAASDAVLRGDTVSSAWEGSPLVPASLVEAVRSGERTGRVGPVLMALADHMDEDNELAIKTTVHLLEPVILIGLGLIVGGMAVSMFLPLFDLTAAGGAGPGGGGP